VLFGIDFPPVSHAIEWPTIFGGDDSWFAVNKVVLLMWLSTAIVFFVLFFAGRKQALVPRGVQNLGESAVDFIRNGIILETMGPEGIGGVDEHTGKKNLDWTPFLLMMFCFVLVGNIWEIIPSVQMPVNSRIALPAFQALVVFVLYWTVGIVKQGPLKFVKNSTIPSGVPWFVLPLVVPIEFLQLVIVRPLSLAVRLFANMLAGHLLLTAFAVITAAVWALSLTIVIWPFSFGLLVGLTGFEVLVAFLQAFIFTILTGVYIGQSMHADH
jgi:F-type H+-transporting ATPase subunit a